MGALLHGLRGWMLAAAMAFVCVTPVRAQAPDLSSIHTIGVISAIGHSIALKNVGLMVFGNSMDTIDSSGWGIDAAIQDEIATALAGRFTLKPVAADPVAFSTQATSWWSTSEVPVEDLVAALPGREGIDAYLVIYPFPLQDPVYGTNQFIRGLGVYRHGGLGESVSLYAFYRCELIDAKTNKQIVASAGMLGKFSLFDHPLPIAPADAAIWAKKADALTDVQRNAIRTAMTALVRRSLRWALANAGLAADPAPDGN
jgi:hypothetical protein